MEIRMSIDILKETLEKYNYYDEGSNTSNEKLTISDVEEKAKQLNIEITVYLQTKNHPDYFDIPLDYYLSANKIPLDMQFFEFARQQIQKNIFIKFKAPEIKKEFFYSSIDYTSNRLKINNKKNS